MFCKQCGKEIPENSNFCTWCGASQAAAQPAGETVSEPVPQADGPAPKAQEPASEPELVVEPGPAPEAPPAPELVFDLPAPEAGPAPRADEPAPMPLPDPVPGPAGGPAGGPPPVPPTPAQPAGAANASGGVSYDLLLKIFAAICGVICLLRALGSVGGVFSNLFTLVRYANIPSLFYTVLNLATVVCYLGATAMLALLALRRTKENTEALVFGLVASAAGLLIVRLLSVFVSILLNVVFYKFFNFSMLLSYLGGLLGLAFWLALCVGGVWGILYLMKEAPQPASVINDPAAKMAVIAEALKKGAGDVQQQAGAAAASAKSAYDAHQAQQAQAARQAQAQAQAAGYPAATRIPTNRSLIAYILLSIITCGIYSYYFIYSIARDANTMCRDDGEKTGGLLAFILLSFVTCGFYGLYWEYKLGNRLAANAPRYGLAFQENGTSVLLWYLVGSLLCGIGPWVAMYILIKNTNALAAAYNAANGL